MITLTKLSGEQFVLNAQLIRTVETTPDTTVRLTSGGSIMVVEGLEEVVALAVEYEQLLRGLVPKS